MLPAFTRLNQMGKKSSSVNELPTLNPQLAVIQRQCLLTLLQTLHTPYNGRISILAVASLQSSYVPDSALKVCVGFSVEKFFFVLFLNVTLL
jgi:hypothetical protein